MLDFLPRTIFYHCFLMTYLAVAIKVNACLAVRQESAWGVNGKPYVIFGTNLSASEHNSNKPET